MRVIIGLWTLFFLISGCGPGEGTQFQPTKYTAYMHPDELADRIINEDPDMLIVDLRSEEAYGAFTIPGAINMPLDSWMDREAELKSSFQGQRGVVLVDDKGVDSRFASVYLKEKGICEPFILEGGLENFVQTIFIPQEKEAALMDDASIEKMNFRKAAAMYFAGLSKPIEPQPYLRPRPKPKKTVKVAPKKKVEDEEEEGC